jgi:protein-disulfide isomerase-like protein with CxxC motif
MNAELFFIYDTHCPWSYATTSLVNCISAAFPEMPLNLLHSARYEGDELINQLTLDAIINDSNIRFSSNYIDELSQEKDSTLSANLLAWTQSKSPQLVLPLINAIQKQHFEQGLALTTESDFADIINEYKISPPSKVFNNNKLTKDAESIVHHVFEFQELINTTAIPALLLAVENQLILLNHNLYLTQPESVIEAINLEINK